MSAPPRPKWTREDYDRDAWEFRDSLPLEHFAQTTWQSAQRTVTNTATALLSTRKPGFRCFNRLLVQKRSEGRMIRVVPDNMIVLDFSGSESLQSWAVELAPCSIFWVLDYVWEENPFRDYARDFHTYEGDLKVPYCLSFETEKMELRLYRHSGIHYALVEANPAGRYPLPEIDFEVALRGDEARFWYKGELLPTTSEMQGQLTSLRREIDELRRGNEALRRGRETA